MNNGFIKVPQTKMGNGAVHPPFYISQHPCRRGENGEAIISAEGEPWIVDSIDAAKEACKKSGYKLLTDGQFLAIATNFGTQQANLDRGRNLLPDPGWIELSNGQRIHGFRSGLWVDGKSVDFGLDEKGPTQFFCTKGIK